MYSHASHRHDVRPPAYACFARKDAACAIFVVGGQQYKVARREGERRKTDGCHAVSL